MNIPVIAAISSDNAFEEAICSDVSIIFDLHPCILTLNEKVKAAHQCGKKIFIHLDLSEGIGKDKTAVQFVKNSGADGIISTRTNMIKYAHEIEIFSIQRFFAIDSRSVETAIESLKTSKPDMIEILPGICEKVIKKMRHATDIPIIAGGLIETKEEISSAISSGAYGISTGAKELWHFL